MLGIHAKRFGEKYRHLQVDLYYFNVPQRVLFNFSLNSNHKINSNRNEITDDAKPSKFAKV